MYPSHSGSLLTFHRADFQTVLLRKLPTSYRIHCSKRLRSYEQRHGGPITLLFEDGTNAFCDVLIGADGLKSAVRRSLLEEKASKAQSQNNWSEAADIRALIEPTWSGTNAYRALIPVDRLRSRHSNHRTLTQPMMVKLLFFLEMIFIDCNGSLFCWRQYLGKNAVRHLISSMTSITLFLPFFFFFFFFHLQYVIAYPISRGTMVNFVAFISRHDLENSKFNGAWVCFSDKSELIKIFGEWESEVQALVDVCQNFSNERWKRNPPHAHILQLTSV